MFPIRYQVLQIPKSAIDMPVRVDIVDRVKGQIRGNLCWAIQDRGDRIVDPKFIGVSDDELVATFFSQKRFTIYGGLLSGDLLKCAINYWLGPTGEFRMHHPLVGVDDVADFIMGFGE